MRVVTIQKDHGNLRVPRIQNPSSLTKSASQSDFGGFPVASSSMTVESKCVLHTKLVVFASIESVLSEK